MRKLFSAKILFASVLILTLLAGSNGFSQKKSGKAPESGALKLTYNYPSGKAIKYLVITKVVQNMDVNGQSMLVNVNSSLSCSVRSSGRQGENLKLEIMIDSMAQSVESPQKTSGGTLNEVKGKVFKMIITPAGKPTDLTEAAKIVFNTEGSGESNIARTFSNYFPALPAGRVKPGDTWISHDTLDSKDQNQSIWMPMESVCTFEGVEKINGTDCARISAKLTGTRKMFARSQGMEINTSGSFSGTKILLFAIREGYFAKETVTTRMTGTIEIRDQNMSIPVVMDITSTNEMVK